MPIDEINYVSAGINHMAFYLKFAKDDQRIYPAIQKVYNQNRHFATPLGGNDANKY